MSQRAQWVDVAKGLGIGLVVYGHVARGVVNAGLAPESGPLGVADSVIYSFHMPLFFLLSGLFFERSYSRNGAVGVMWSKVDTIVYPYLVWSLLQGSVQVGMSGHTNDSYGVGRLLQILWDPISPFWFLYALFAIFAVAVLSRRWLGRRFVPVFPAASAIAYLVTARTGAPEQVLFVTQNAVFFGAGVVMSRSRLTVGLARVSWTHVAGLGAAAAVGQYVFHVGLDARYGDRGVLTLVLAALSIGAVVVLAQRFSATAPAILGALGSASMGIYVMHIVAASGTRIALSSVLGVSSVPVHLVVGSVVGVFGPFAVVKIAEHFELRFLFSAPIAARLRRSGRGGPPIGPAANSSALPSRRTGVNRRVDSS